MISVILEQAINHLLSIDDDIDCHLLEGKLIAISITDTAINLSMVFSSVSINNRVDINSNPKYKVSVLSQACEGLAYDVNINLTKGALPDLLKGMDAKSLLKSDKISVVGDAKTAQALLDLMTDLDLAPQEIIAFYANETIAHGVSAGVKFLKDNPPPKPIVDNFLWLKGRLSKCLLGDS